MRALARQIRDAALSGFESQARDHGAALHRAATAARARDPMVAILLDTFDRQTRERCAKAVALSAAGDVAGGKAMAQWALVAAENAKRIRDAVEGKA